MSYEMKKSQSHMQPKIVDKDSSAFGIYYRKNIEEFKDEMENTMYQYDEYYLPVDKFKFDIEDEQEYVEKIEEIFAEEAKQERIEEIKNELNNIDNKSIRSIRAISLGEATEEDENYLKELEMQAQDLREELAKLLN